MVRFEGVALVDSLKEMSFGVGDPGVSFIAFFEEAHYRCLHHDC